MLKEGVIQQIINYHCEDYPVVSFYLNVVPERQPGGAYKIAAKDLVKEIKQWIKQNEKELNREKINSLQEDIEKFLQAVNKLALPTSARGYVVFSCNGKGLWEELFLPLAVDNLVMISADPFVRPLINILERYKSYGLCMVDRSRMLCAELYINEVVGVEEMTEEVPKKVRYGGWQGYSEARIQRHVEERVFWHLKNAAAFAIDFFKNRSIERLIVSAPAALISDFEALLPDSLRRRIVAHRSTDLFSNNKKDLLSMVKEIDDSLREEEEKMLVEKIISEREKSGNGVIGLYESLRSLEAGAILTLVVGEDYAEKGFRCRSCGYLSIVEGSCPLCAKPLRAEKDIIDELIAEALRRGANIKHLYNKQLTAKIQNIGALLRFKPPI